MRPPRVRLMLWKARGSPGTLGKGQDLGLGWAELGYDWAGLGWAKLGYDWARLG